MSFRPWFMAMAAAWAPRTRLDEGGMPSPPGQKKRRTTNSPVPMRVES